MKLGIFEPAEHEKAVSASLGRAGIETVPVGDEVPDVDGVLVAGGDKGVRRYFRQTDAPGTPVLGLSEGAAEGFLAQVGARALADCAGRLLRGDYEVEEIPRLGVRVDGKNSYAVLNDAAVFSSRSAVLMEHTLLVDGQEVWHDNSDGVIVSTPLGSTAYSMSAGGPMIFQGAPVFGIVSVNSLDNTRRPLVVSGGSRVVVDEISARVKCEVVLDGTDRTGVKRSVECFALKHPARIIRMQKDTTSISALAKKVHLAEDLLSMPPSSKLLLKTLEYEGSMTQRDLASRTMLPYRTVHTALTHLLKKGYVRKNVSAWDARQRTFQLTGAVSGRPGGGGDKGAV